MALLGRVSRIERLLDVRRAEVLRPHGLTTTDIDVLASLWRHHPNGQRPRDLRRTMMIGSGTLTPRLDRLEADGWRHPDPDDRARPAPPGQPGVHLQNGRLGVLAISHDDALLDAIADRRLQLGGLGCCRWGRGSTPQRRSPGVVSRRPRPDPSRPGRDRRRSIARARGTPRPADPHAPTSSTPGSRAGSRPRCRSPSGPTSSGGGPCPRPIRSTSGSHLVGTWTSSHRCSCSGSGTEGLPPTALRPLVRPCLGRGCRRLLGDERWRQSDSDANDRDKVV
jgi:hypothetical protein